MRAARQTPWLTVLFLLCGVTGVTIAQDVVAPRHGLKPVEAPLRFRRVYAPADRVSDWPTGSARYVPVARDEFERLVVDAQRSTATAPPSASLVRAEYTANLDTAGNLQGALLWTIERAANSRELLSIAPLGIALGEARWRASHDPAQIGLAEQVGPTLVVDQSGEIAGKWTLAGRPDAEGQLSFRFELPRATTSVIRLSLPRDVAPTASAGLVSVRDGKDDRQSCEILLSGQPIVTVRLTKRTTISTSQPDIFLRESLVYDISSRGIDLTAVWRLDLHATTRRQLSITLDRGLLLVSARVGETEVVASRMPGGEDGATKYILELPDALAASERALRLMAVGPLVLGEPWTIPRIRAQDASWQEGTCTLLVHEPQVVGELSTRECRETKCSLLPEQNRGESFEFQLFSDRWAIETTLTRDRPAVRVTSATSLVLAAASAQAQIIAELDLTSGRRSVLIGDVDSAWTVDGVESVPAGNIENWNIETAGVESRLVVTLARALVPDEPQKLLIRAHRHAPLRSPLEWHAEDLSALRFRESSGNAQFFTIAAAPPLELRLLNTEGMPTVAADQYASTAGTLFSASPAGPVYRLTPGQGQLIATTEARPAPCDGEIRVRAVLTRDTLNEFYQFRIEAERDEISQVLVSFNHSRVEPVRWRVEGAQETTLVAYRLSAAERLKANVAGAAELWRLKFTPPLRGAIDISANRETATAEEIPLSLANLPEATTCGGRLTVVAAADLPISIRTAGVKPVEINPSDRTATERELFEYSTNGFASANVTVTRELDSLAVAGAALVWQRRVESRYDQSGRSQIRTSFDIRNAGRGEVTIATPADTRITRVWVDGKLQTGQFGGSKATVSLSVEQAQVNLVAECTATGAPFGAGRSIVAESADIDLPILDTEWRVQLPAGFELSLVEGGNAEPAAASYAVADRLLGPLLTSWKTLATTSTSTVATEREDAPLGAEYLIHADGGTPPGAHVVRTSTARSWFVASLIISAAACNLYERRARLLAAMILFAAAAALLSPPSMVPIACGGMWGIAVVLAGKLVHRYLRPLVQRAKSADPTAQRFHAVAHSVTIFFSASLWLLGLASAAVAQQSAARTSGDTPSVVHRVFVPVDDQEQPTTDKYQLPEQFYDELRRRAGGAAGQMRGGIIRSARYQVSLSREAGGETFSASDIIARYEVLVLQPNSSVRIPTGVVRPFPIARRDGQAVDLIWDSDEEGFVATLAEPGNYELELLLRPQRGKNSTAALDLPIPPIANATLDMHLPAAAPTVEILSALGPVALSADGSTLSAQLGPADRLSLRWSKNRSARAVVTGAEADVWQWLQIQPSSVTLHARLVISGQKAPFSELLLSVDPRLRPLPVVDRTGTVASVQSVAGDPQSVRVLMSRPVSEGTTIPVSFLLTGSSGVGQLTLPHLMPQGIRVAGRLLAVSVDPALEYKLPDEDAPEAIAVADFLGRWGVAPAAPQLAVRLGDDRKFDIAIRPREPHLSTRQRLAIGLDVGRAQIQFDANITPIAGEASTGEILRYQLRVPANLDIEKLVLEQEGIDRVSRWTRESPGEVNLFLAAPLSGRQELRLAGSFPLPSSGAVDLPQIRIVPAGRSDTTVWIFRQPAVQAFVEDRQGMIVADRPRSVADPLLSGRLLTTLAAQGDEYGATLRIVPNEPRIQSLALISVDRVSGAWEGRIDYRTSVEEGCLDQIAVTIPPEWTGPFEITPPGTSEQLESTGGETRLVVRPLLPIEGSYQLVIRCPLRWNEAESLALPAILPAPREAGTTYALLPHGLGTERLSWKTEEMRAERLPEGVSSPLPPETSTAYLITGAAPSVARRESPSAPAAASTADIQVAWAAGSPLRGVARFTLTADHTAACELAVPDGLQILALRRNGLPISAQRTAQGTWKMPLDSEAEVREIEVVFRGESPVAAEFGGIRLLAPALLSPLPTRTDWIVVTPQGTSSIAVGESDVPAIPPDATNSVAASRATPRFAFGEHAGARFSFAGNVPTLTLHTRTTWQSGTLLRGLLALLCGGTGMLLFRRARRER